MPRDITVTFADGSQTIYKGAPDNVTPEQVTARAQQEFGQPVASLDGGRPAGLAEAGRVLDKSLRGGLTALPGVMADTGLAVIRNLKEIKPQNAGIIGGLLSLGEHFMPGKADEGPIASTKFGDATKALQTLGGILPPVSEPQTPAGKYAASAGEGVVSTVTGGGVGSTLGKALTGGLGGFGSELAAHFLGDNALSRLAGAAVGGGLPAGAQALKGNAETIIKQAVDQMTPSDWRRAKVLEATLEREGIPHLKSQILGPRSTLDDTVAVAGTNPAVRPKLISKVENSADKARDAAERFNLQNLPINVGERQAVLDDVQQAAQDALTSIRKRSNTAYEGAMPSTTLEFMPEKAKLLRQSLYELADSAKYGPTSAAGQAIKRYADDFLTDTGDYLTNAHHWNNLIKEIPLKAGNDYKGLPVAEVKDILKKATPEFDAAREAKQVVMNDEYNPAAKGLTGQLAQMGGGVKPDRVTAKDNALSIVFPTDRPQPQAIINLSKQIGGEGVGELLREHLARNMERATALTSDASRTVQGPFRFVEAVAGTNAQRQNLEAALKVHAEANGMNPATVRNGFYKLMRAFESTKDLKLPAEIDRAALAQQAGKTLPGFMVAPNSRLGRYFWEKATASTYNKIAEVVLAKDGLKQLEAIARSPSPELAKQFAISVITGAGAGQPQE